MATAARFTEILSQALGLSVADVQHRARRLREAGLLPGEGHGRGAPHLNARDCANLLIGILATDTASHVAEAVASVGQLWGRPIVLNGHELLPAMKFADAVAALIERWRTPDSVPIWIAQANLSVGVVQFAGQRHGWIEVQDNKRGRFRVHFLGEPAASVPAHTVTIIPGLKAVGAYLERETAVPAAALWVIGEVLGDPSKPKQVKKKGKGR